MHTHSSCGLCRNDSLKAEGMMTLEPFTKKIVAGHQLFSHIPGFVHEALGSGQHWTALSLFMYLGQSGSAEGNIIHSQI